MLWVKRARQEHDAFADALFDRGVEVLYLHELLAQTLELAEARAQVLDETLAAAQLGRRLGGAVRDWLAELPAPALARQLIGGVAAEELPFRSDALAAQVTPVDGFADRAAAQPSLHADTSCWIAGGVSVNAMAKPARRREALHLAAIYAHHPLFADVPHETWSDGLGGARLAGGRRRARDRQRLRARRDGRADATRCGRAAGRTPLRRRRGARADRDRAAKQRSAMHLDTVMTMVDRDAFTIFPELRGAMTSYRLTAGARRRSRRAPGRPLRGDRADAGGRARSA